MPLIPPIKRKKLVVTGYGPFGHYTENPSSIVVKKLKETGLPDDLKLDYELETHLLDVAYDKADHFVSEKVQKTPAHVRFDKSLEMCIYKIFQFYIHIGVHPFKNVIKLEQQSSSGGYCKKDINGKSHIYFVYTVFCNLYIYIFDSKSLSQKHLPLRNALFILT